MPKLSIRSLLVGLVAVTAVGCKSMCGGSGTTVDVDGSSTVYPITESVAEAFQKFHSARVTIGVSGTGGGLQKFCRGDIAIANASRPIGPTEIEACDESDIDFIELPIASDGITVVAHPSNDWVQHLDVETLRTIWRPDAQGNIETWNDLRDDWPDESMALFSPGVDSGTYDYFTEVVVGEEGKSRGDVQSSEEDNVLVRGVANDEYALGFFGYAYFDENREKLRAVPIDDGNSDNGAGPVAPSSKTIADGTYQPLSRPLFLYVRADAASEPAVRQFVRFYLQESRELISEVGYVPLSDQVYSLAWKRFENRTTGTIYGTDSEPGAGPSLEERLRAAR